MSMLKLFRVHYTDNDPCFPPSSVRVRAHNKRDAEERFLDSCEFEGFDEATVLKIETIREGGQR